MDKPKKILVLLPVAVAMLVCGALVRDAVSQNADGAKAAEVKEGLAVDDVLDLITGDAPKVAPAAAPAADAAKDAPADVPKAAEPVPAVPAADVPAAVPAAAPAAADVPKVEDPVPVVPAAAPAAEPLAEVKPAPEPVVEVPKVEPAVPAVQAADVPKSEPAVPVAPVPEVPKSEPVAPAAPVVDDGAIDKLNMDLLNSVPAAPKANGVDQDKRMEAVIKEVHGEPEVKPAAPAVVADPVPEAVPAVVSVPVVVPVTPVASGAAAPAVGTPDVEVPGVELPKGPEQNLPPEVGLMRDSEELRRRAYERHARESLEEGDKSFMLQKYQVATKYYQESVNSFKEAGYRADNENERLRALNGLRDSIYMEAVDLMNKTDYENAEKKARNALIQGHRLAGELIGEIRRRRDAPPPEKKVEVKQRWKEEGFQKREENIAKLITRAREYYLSGELDNAQRELDEVMKKDMDPFNTEAMRLMEKIARRRGDLATMELEYTRRTMTADVRKTWNRRDYGIDDRPRDIPPEQGRVERKVDTKEKEILDKMAKIEIPDIEFRQANIQDVIRFLQAASVDHDPEGDRAKKRGVNIILHLGAAGGMGGPGAAVDGGAAGGAAVADPFAPDPAAGAGAGGAGGAAGEIPLITFSARYITLLEALKIVTSIGSLKWRVEGSVVMVVPVNFPDGDIVHRSYDVMASFVEVTRKTKEELDAAAAQDGMKRITDAGAGGAGVDLKALFSEMGVRWPDGSFIKFVPSIGKLMVANTANNLTLFEEKLAMLNVVPNQIEIEARFVEVRQTDLSSLGFEFGLADDWEMMHRTDVTGVPITGRPRIVMEDNMTAGGFTKGNRFLRTLPGGEAVNDDILRISSVLTNPELSFVLHALQQKGNADLLSAPKVTTQAGQEASIKVVTEYIYPTEFEVEPITAGDDANARIVGAIVEPGSFETREVGVILSVMPQVTPEGAMIILTMSPEVVSEPIWKNYGSVYIDPDGNEQRLNMEQPFFHTRTVTTQIAIYNGATVVMGGMINELRNEVDDKIPFLGDIPLLGRFFRSRHDNSEKRNLLIFVTARLVDPNGRPLKSRSDKALNVRPGSPLDTAMKATTP